MSFSPEQQQLLAVIHASQQPDTIQAAEAQLEKYATEYQGYALLMLSLLQPAMAEAIGRDHQTAIAINLKRYVLKHWCTSVKDFTPPQVPDAEKAQIHAHILPLLATPYASVRRQLSSTIDEIAESDFPEKWTSLLPDVLAILHQAVQAGHDATPAQTNLLTGTLSSLSEFTACLEDHQLVSTIPTLFPALLELCQKKFELLMQIQRASPLPELSEAQQVAVKDAIQVCVYSLKVYESCCQSINNMNILANQDTRSSGKKSAAGLNKVLNEFLIPSLPTWWTFLASILTMPAGSGVFDFALAFPTSWGLRLEAVKCLTNLSERFGEQILARGVEGAKIYETSLQVILDTMANLYPMYAKLVLNTEDDDGGEEEQLDDEDGNVISMTVFLFESFGHFRSILGMRPPKKTKPPAKGKKPTASAQINATKQVGYEYLKSLFGPTSGLNFLPRLLQLSLQYGQLTSREITSSLTHMDEYLTSAAATGDEDDIGTTVNARLGVKNLLMDCLLYQAEGADEDLDELAAMGFMDVGGVGGEGAGTVMVERAYVLHVLCPLLTELLRHSLSLRGKEDSWWKGRELATLLVGYIVGDIIEAQAAAAAPPAKKKAGKKAAASAAVQSAQPPAFDLQSFVRDILLADLSFTSDSASNHPLLRAQTLASTARFAPVFLKAKEASLVVLALEAIVQNMQPPTKEAPATLLTRIAAVDAFGTLCAHIDKELLMHNNILPAALTNICQLVHAASQPAEDGAEVDEASLVKVIHTLITAISVNQQTTIAAEPTLTPLLLGAWSANATVPYIADGVTDAFEDLLKLAPETCVSVQTKVLPVLSQIFHQSQGNVAVSGSVAAALSLLQHVLLSVEKHTRVMKAASGQQSTSPSSGEPTAAPELLHPLLFSDLLPATLQMVLHNTDDHDMIEVGTQVLTAFLRIDSAKVAALSMPIVLPGAEPNTPPTQMNGVQILCTIINQFLQPTMDDKVAHNSGTLIVQVVLSFGSMLGEANIRELIKGVVVRLHSSLYPPLDQSLILVFARLIHSSSVETVLSIVAGLGRIQAQEKELVRVKTNQSDQYASFTQTVLKTVEVDALPFLISKWIRTQEDRVQNYPSKVLHLALVKLMTYIFTPSAPGADLLRNLECRGYIVPAKVEKKRPVTRQATAASGNSSSHEPEYTKIPLSAKLLSMFLKEWKDWEAQHAVRLKAEARRAKRLAREAGEDVADDEDDDEDYEDDYDDDDGEFDDDDDGDDDSEWIKQMQGKMGAGGQGKSPFASADDFPDLGRGALAGNQKLMTLSDMLDHHAGDEFELDGETEEEIFPESVSDPLNAIQLGPFVQNFVREFAQAQNGAMVQEAGRYLDEADQKVLHALMESPLPSTPQKK